MRWPLYLRQGAKGLQRHLVGAPAGDDDLSSAAQAVHMTLCPRCAHKLGAIPQIHAVRPVGADTNSFSCETCGRSDRVSASS